MAFIRFTEEQKEQARYIDLAAFLKSRGEKLKRAGSEYEWNYGGEKITIRGNLWYNQYKMEGGDIIDFVRDFYNLTFSEAVELLLSGQGISVFPEQTIRQKEKKPFALPSANPDMRRVYAYLLKRRFLDREVVQFFTHAGLLYEDREFHNAVFVGLDENGVPRHAHKRGTYSESGYKGNVEGSEPEYSFHHIGTGNRLYVFEAPVDMLSYISLHKANWREHSYVALCSVAPHGALHILKTNPHIDTVITCLDHDGAGIDGNHRIKEAVLEAGDYTVTWEQPEFKDWNEGLKKEHGLKPIIGTEHSGLVRMRELCRELVSGYFGESCSQYPLEDLRERYERLRRLPVNKRKEIQTQSQELAGAAFLLARKQFAALEKSYTAPQYETILLRLYAPHHDHSGYKSRVIEIGERLEHLQKVFQANEIVPESKQMEQIKNILSLAVDGLRLSVFMEQQQNLPQRRESPDHTEGLAAVM